jgi:outer membrane receptor protein involved in Fe transport
VTRLTRTAIAIAIAATATPVFAESSGRQLEEVIVTAERKEASVQDTSISITAFTTEMLDDFGIRNQEDLQNFVPATTIQPYDATVRGVGRNFRALGGDPGVATYMNGVYSEDLLTATAATFWDVDRIEVLRGPQGTLYGRNAVGGAINILYKEPTDGFDYAFKGIVGNFGTAETYGMVNGTLIEDKLYGRFNFATRDRDGVIDEIGGGDDLDGLGTENIAALFKFTPNDTMEIDVRFNKMDIDREFGGANGGGLVVLNEEGTPSRNTSALIGGYRAIDTANTNPAAYATSTWYDTTQPVLEFTHPTTGEIVLAQHARAGVDDVSWAGAMNAAASLDGFNFTSPESAARYNDCVFGGDIEGDDLCGATNGLNREEFNQQGTQLTFSWDATENLTLKYIYGYNKLSYQRTTDDDNTASQFIDRQFYVNHEALYDSHEFQAFYDFSDNFSITSGIFFYDAEIDQRGDLYSTLADSRFREPYNDAFGLDGIVAFLLPGIITSRNVGGNFEPAATFNGQPPTLHSARTLCQDPATRKAQCDVNYAVNNPAPAENNNIHLGVWTGDDGTLPDLDVEHGPNLPGSDLLYHTRTEREAFAAYTQAVWDINDTFTLTMGVRYAEDEVEAEENVWRYVEAANGVLQAIYSPNGLTFADGGFVDATLANFIYNTSNGGLVPDPSAPGGWAPTKWAVNGGVPLAISIYRPFKRKDDETTFRVNLDWNINDDILMYLSATSGYRSGGYNLIFFSATPTYDPEELTAYELGYKTQLLDGTLQLNGSFYLYDYESVHTVATEVTPPLIPGDGAGSTTSVLAAPSAEIYGIEAEALWLASDRWTIGGNFSFTPSEYDADLFIRDPAGFRQPDSLFNTDDGQDLIQNVKGNQMLQVPELKYAAWASYALPLNNGSNLVLSGVYSWIDEVYYSPFESDDEKAEDYGRLDLRATWTSADGKWVVSGFVNNVTDDVGVLQVLREGEAEHFRHTAGTTVPRLYGLELTYSLNP